MPSVFVHWDDVIQMASGNKCLFTCRKRLEVFNSLVQFRYTMINQQAYIIDIWLKKWMRVLAMRLKMEIIRFIKFKTKLMIILYISINIHPKQYLRVPTVQHSRCEGDRFPHVANHAPLITQ